MKNTGPSLAAAFVGAVRGELLVQQQPGVHQTRRPRVKTAGARRPAQSTGGQKILDQRQVLGPHKRRGAFVEDLRRAARGGRKAPHRLARFYAAGVVAAAVAAAPQAVAFAFGAVVPPGVLPGEVVPGGAEFFSSSGDKPSSAWMACAISFISSSGADSIN